MIIVPLTEIQRQLVADNRGLAWTAAGIRYRGRHGQLTMDELITAAEDGLIFAAGHYESDPAGDPTNKRWVPYVMLCADGAILDAMKHEGLIHVPEYLLKPAGKLHRFWPDAERAAIILPDDYLLQLEA